MAFTFFFRDMQTLELAIKHMIPYTAGRSRIRIWDAGCAMGPEPYSLAIMLAEKMGHFSFKNLSLHATDLDKTFGEVIQAGEYPEGDLQRIPNGLFEKYFEPAGRPGYFRVIDTIQSRVSFKWHDLLSLQPIGDDFSLILCKNVLLHLQQAERIEVIKMFHRTLSPGGFFATEQTQKLPTELSHLFEQVTADAQIFRKIEVKQ
jgi:chemotaxis protein methyltransferase CheR